MVKIKRLIAIGDIHGCSDKLTLLLESLSLQKDDRLIFLGDYINRGVDSRGVIEIIVNLKKSGHDVICLMGNHEKLLIDYSKHPHESLIPYLRQMGIDFTLESYGEKNLNHIPDLSFLPMEHASFLRELKLYHKEDKYLFVHAGIRPDRPLEAQTPSDLCEIRDLFIESEKDSGYIIVFGHTPFELPLVTKNKIGIDTGAVYGHLLTALILPDMKFIHA